MCVSVYSLSKVRGRRLGRKSAVMQIKGVNE